MDQSRRQPLVTTIKEKCRVCYTCVRECPAKAIRIFGGQAEVLVERCIGCGNCVRVCSQHAKDVLSSVDEIRRLIESDHRVAACLAPSFPAEFGNIGHEQVVGMVRALGFDFVQEVGFGADLVADRYARLLRKNPDQRYIATNCPAIVEFVERYHHDLVRFLTPVVSPMLATARALRQIYGSELKIVFIGPCIAKKAEMDPAQQHTEIDGVLTFTELHSLLIEKAIRADSVAPSDFDEPRAGAGALFPISRGMLQAAKISEDLMAGDVVAADGRLNFVEAIKEFESGALNARLLEVLCCNGCIMGPGISNNLPLFTRRSLVSKYVRARASRTDVPRWREWIERFKDLDLSRKFAPNEQTIPMPTAQEITAILNRMGKFSPQDELNCGACGYDSCHDHAIAIHSGLAEIEMCLPYTIDQLRKTLKELAVSHEQLASVQAALIQSEKLASMGQLAAAVAHEVNNPLGVVLMYAHLLLDECEKDSKLRDDLAMIVEQTDRCKKIVAGLLNFARQKKVVRQPTNLCELIDRCLNTLPAPHGVEIRIQHQVANPTAELDADQIMQVLVNLINNAYEAMPYGGVLSIQTSDDKAHVQFEITDTGIGISRENLSKLFEPFFTTKQLGKGTGLGLAIAYGIIKMHRGDIRVESNADSAAGPTGTRFTVTLPREEQQN